MKKRPGNNAINSVLIAAIILVITGSGFAAYRILSNPKSSSNNANVAKGNNNGSTSATSNWRTYIDHDNGFLFRYPLVFTTQPVEMKEHIVNLVAQRNDQYFEPCSDPNCEIGIFVYTGQVDLQDNQIISAKKVDVGNRTGYLYDNQDASVGYKVMEVNLDSSHILVVGFLDRQVAGNDSVPVQENSEFLQVFFSTFTFTASS